MTKTTNAVKVPAGPSWALDFVCHFNCTIEALSITAAVNRTTIVNQDSDARQVRLWWACSPRPETRQTTAPATPASRPSWAGYQWAAAHGVAFGSAPACSGPCIATPNEKSHDRTCAGDRCQETDAAVVAVKSVKSVSNSLMIQIMRHYNLGFSIQHLNFTDIDCMQLWCTIFVSKTYACVQHVHCTSPLARANVTCQRYQHWQLTGSFQIQNGNRWTNFWCRQMQDDYKSIIGTWGWSGQGAAGLKRPQWFYLSSFMTTRCWSSHGPSMSTLWTNSETRGRQMQADHKIPAENQTLEFKSLAMEPRTTPINFAWWTQQHKHVSWGCGQRSSWTRAPCKTHPKTCPHSGDNIHRTCASTSMSCCELYK